MSKYMKLPLSFGARNVGIADTGDYDGVVEIKDADGKVIFQNWNGDDFDEERARRIAACVNVCAGVPIEILEATGASLTCPGPTCPGLHGAEDYWGGVMTDKELLEMAAKAAGGHLMWQVNGITVKSDSMLNGKFWNPLKDDGDALRLLAVLPSLWGLSLKFGTPSIKMSVAWGTGRGIEAVEFAGEGADRATAIRRAIVRAAAEIGKGLPK